MTKTNEFLNIANKLIHQLDELGIEAYIWHKATTGSVYIRFKDNRMCSVRLGDHEGRGKLKYKYNLRNDISSKHPKWVKDENVWRYYLHMGKWKDLISVLVDRHKQIQSWNESKYSYNIPKFKQQQTDNHES